MLQTGSFVPGGDAGKVNARLPICALSLRYTGVDPMRITKPDHELPTLDCEVGEQGSSIRDRLGHSR